MDIIIRDAKKEDMKQVFQMVRDLAVFEKMEDQVKINAQVMEEDGFGTENPAFKCFVAEHSAKIVGYALYYYCYSTWLGKSLFLEDLYVVEDYRKHGIGKKLFMAVAKLAKESSGRLDFHVLSWNPAIDFYKKLGAVNLTQAEQWNTFRIYGDSLNKLFE